MGYDKKAARQADAASRLVECDTEAAAHLGYGNDTGLIAGLHLRFYDHGIDLEDLTDATTVAAVALALVQVAGKHGANAAVFAAARAAADGVRTGLAKAEL